MSSLKDTTKIYINQFAVIKIKVTKWRLLLKVFVI